MSLHRRTAWRCLALADRGFIPSVDDIATRLVTGQQDPTMPHDPSLPDPDSMRVRAIVLTLRACMEAFRHDPARAHLVRTPLAYYDTWPIPPEFYVTTANMSGDQKRQLMEASRTPSPAFSAADDVPTKVMPGPVARQERKSRAITQPFVSDTRNRR